MTALDRQVAETAGRMAPPASVALTVGAWASLIGFGLLAYRARQQILARDYSRARADAAALDRLARVTVAVRDAANTPLQTLEVSAALLESKHLDAKPIVDRITRAVSRLRQLTQVLATYERPQWQHGDDSFDAEERLRALTREQSRSPRRP